MYFFKINILKLKIIDFNYFYFISIYFLIFELRISIRELALLRLFSFSYFIFHNSFSHLHLFTYLIFYILDLFKLYINTFNYLDILFSSILYTSLLQHLVVFQSLLVLFIYLLNYLSIL